MLPLLGLNPTELNIVTVLQWDVSPRNKQHPLQGFRVSKSSHSQLCHEPCTNNASFRHYLGLAVLTYTFTKGAVLRNGSSPCSRLSCLQSACELHQTASVSISVLQWEPAPNTPCCSPQSSRTLGSPPWADKKRRRLLEHGSGKSLRILSRRRN